MGGVAVITVDGPGGSGKGTICQMLARELGFHLLDSGALYRLVGLSAVRHGVDFADEAGLAQIATGLDVRFEPTSDGEPVAVILENQDVSDELRTEQTGEYASLVAKVGAVRDALMGRQRAFARAPGLVADGRDMGTVVFPDASLKIFLTASAEERAARRHKQLIDKGQTVSLAALLRDIELRDKRDSERAVSPLVPAADAELVDTTGMSIPEVFEHILGLARKRPELQPART